MIVGSLVRLNPNGMAADGRAFLFAKVSKHGPEVFRDEADGPTWMFRSDIGLVLDVSEATKTPANPMCLRFCRLFISNSNVVGWVREDWLEIV